MDVGILDEKIVAAGHTASEVLEKALKRLPNRKREGIEIRYIDPDADFLIL